jgi:hypothetical protein
MNASSTAEIDTQKTSALAKLKARRKLWLDVHLFHVTGYVTPSGWTFSHQHY